MPTKADEVFVEIRARFDKLDQDMAQVGQKIERGLSTPLKRVGQIAAGVFSAQLISRGLSALREFTNEGIRLAGVQEGVKRRFDQLNQATLLEDLRGSVRGTVSDLVLMQAAVRADNFRIGPEVLAKGFEFARRRAQQTGESVDFLVNSLVDGIGRKSTLVLDNLGISVTELQEEIKKTGDFALAAANIMERSMGDATDEFLTGAEKVAQFNTKLDNLQILLGTKLLPLQEKLIERATKWVDLMNFIVDGLPFTEGQLNTIREMASEFKNLNDEARTNEIQRIASNIQDVGNEIQSLKQELDDNKFNKGLIGAVFGTDQNDSITADIKKQQSALKELNAVFKRYQAILRDTGEETKEFVADERSLLEVFEIVNDKFDERIKKAQELNKALEELGRVPVGRAPNEAEINRFVADQGEGEEAKAEDEEALRRSAEVNKNILDDRIAQLENLGEIQKLVFGGFSDLLSAAGPEFQAFGKIIQSVIIAIIQAEKARIAAGVAGSQSSLGPIGLALAPAIIAGFLGLIPKFASGGSVSSPTQAIVGDQRTPRSNPEGIGTLDDFAIALGDKIGIGGGQLVARISGEYIELVRGENEFILDQT